MARKYASDEYYESEPVELTLGNVNIGLVTVSGIEAGTTSIGFATVEVASNTAWSDPNTYIGLATVEVAANTAWADPNTFIGLATVEVANDVNIEGFSNKTLTSNTTTTAKSGAGMLHTINISQVSCPTITLWDSATPNGTVIHTFHPGSPAGPYIFDVNFTNGLTLFATGDGVAPQLQLSYR